MNQIIMGIATSRLQEGDPLPSVRQLADTVGINMHTVNKAYSLLRQEGFVTIDRRRGAIIAVDVDKIKALEEMKAAAKTEKTENTQKKEETKNQSSESSKTTSSVKKENTGKTEKTESQVSSSAKKPASSSSSSAKKPASSAPSASSKPSNGGTTTLKNNGCEIDTSKAVAGTIRVRQNGNPTKVKVLVYFNGSSKYYQYTIPTNNTWTSIPLQSGSGTYKVRFMKQVSGNSYSQMYSVTFQVGMQNANSAYLNPSQYVVYNSGSACVAKAKSLVSGAGSDAQKVSKIYSYIVNNISYDYDKMKNLPSGYLPNRTAPSASRKGICFDYAALMAAMLRSQGVPCKLVIGNADGQYHAWNMVYVNGSWQLYDPTFGAAGQRAGSYVAERCIFENRMKSLKQINR